MLVLSRKPNEEILIGDNIKVTVLKVKGNTVRIGIEAPAAVKVKRGELPDNRPAGATAGNGLALNQNGERAEIELTLSFSPTEEGVSAGKESPAKREHAEVLKFEPAATKTRRSKATASPNQASQRLVSMPATDAVDRAQGTNRIKEILSRIVPGLPVNGLSLNSLPSDDLADE